MKIAQLLLSHGNGGLEKHVRELSIQLFKAGHDVAVIGDKQFLNTLPAGIARYPVATRLSRLNPALYLSIINSLRRFQPDIIHAQANKATSVLSRLQYFLPAATLGTLHNIKRNIRGFHKLDHVITVSRQLAAPFAIDRRSVIYNGIAPAETAAPDLVQLFSLSPDKPVLLAVGRLVRAKGFDMLLDAIDGLNLSLLLVGEGPERTALEQRAIQMASVTDVRLVGQRNDIAALMRAADGVLISSRREGFSYVFSEALMFGCRILSTDVPVANEVLPPTLLTPVDDHRQFRQKLTQLLAMPDKWSALMSSPRDLAARSMTLEAMCHQTLATYKSLLPEPSC